MSPEKNHPDQDDQQTYQKHKNGNAVDAMHIAHPFTMRCIRVPFFNVEVFCNLPPYSHKKSFTFQRYKTVSSSNSLKERDY